MLNRSTWAVLLLALSGCQPWKVIRESDANPLAGKTAFVLLPLVWNGVQVDGDPEQTWFDGQDDDWRKEWPGNKAVGAAEFQKGATEHLAGGPLKLTATADPSLVTLKPSVQELATGGWRPTILKIAVQVLDVNGATIEEISTQVEVKNRYTNFETRLSTAATKAGVNVARYLEKRSGN